MIIAPSQVFIATKALLRERGVSKATDCLDINAVRTNRCWRSLPHSSVMEIVMQSGDLSVSSVLLATNNQLHSRIRITMVTQFCHNPGGQPLLEDEFLVFRPVGR